MVKSEPDSMVPAHRERRDRSWLEGRRRSYLLAFAVVVAVKILAVLWLLGSAGPALIQASSN
jgi:uncharacterized BrkB/YihY/UPF0761 family membrane protein